MIGDSIVLVVCNMLVEEEKLAHAQVMQFRDWIPPSQPSQLSLISAAASNLTNPRYLPVLLLELRGSRVSLFN